MIFLQPLFRALLAISGLSYLVSATLGNILFDLMGDSLNARSYYCSTLEAATANPLRLMPILFVIVVTAISLFYEVRSAVGSPYFLVELSMVSAMLAVEVPMLVKCIQLEIRGCSSSSSPPSESSESPWPVHRNLLMSHTCILLILIGTLLARIGIVIHRSCSLHHNEVLSSKTSEVSSGSGPRRLLRRRRN
jgi:hypothetical protein